MGVLRVAAVMVAAGCLAAGCGGEDGAGGASSRGKFCGTRAPDWATVSQEACDAWNLQLGPGAGVGEPVEETYPTLEEENGSDAVAAAACARLDALRAEYDMLRNQKSDMGVNEALTWGSELSRRMSLNQREQEAQRALYNSG